MDGYELAACLLTNNPDQPVLLMSACAEVNTRSRTGLTLGLPVLRKPFLPDQLVAKVRETLERVR